MTLFDVVFVVCLRIGHAGAAVFASGGGCPLLAPKSGRRYAVADGARLDRSGAGQSDIGGATSPLRVDPCTVQWCYSVWWRDIGWWLQLSSEMQWIFYIFVCKGGRLIGYKCVPIHFALSFLDYIDYLYPTSLWSCFYFIMMPIFAFFTVPFIHYAT